MGFDPNITTTLRPGTVAVTPQAQKESGNLSVANTRGNASANAVAPYSSTVTLPKPLPPDTIGQRIYVGSFPEPGIGSPAAANSIPASLSTQFTQGFTPQNVLQVGTQSGPLPLPSWLFQQNAVRLPNTLQQPQSPEQVSPAATLPAMSGSEGGDTPPAQAGQVPPAPSQPATQIPQAQKLPASQAPAQGQTPQNQAGQTPEASKPSAQTPSSGAQTPSSEAPSMEAWWNRNKESKQDSQGDDKGVSGLLSQDTIRSLNIRLNNNQESVRADAAMEFFQLLESNAIPEGTVGPPFKTTLEQNPDYRDYVDAFLQKILNDPSPVVREMIILGLGNGYVSEVSAPVYHTMENMLSQGGGPFGIDRSDIEKALAHIRMRQEESPEKPSRGERRRMQKAEDRHQHSSGAFAGNEQSENSPTPAPRPQTPPAQGPKA
ncbi:MAG: hypothetical protein VKJ04_00120 [Vampirovibrionales bacterium]|nr:hypothetical protein [Vampirovibrionales bacterium]